ncbi:MAG: cysteine hydrolase [Desulfobacterales bacterium]|nr:cysteine hydrolase [Desulfobacterales bacterium]
METALIVIDIQNDYFPNGKMELEGSVEASLRAKDALLFFREKKLPVIHIQHISVRPGSTFFLPDTEGVNIHENVQPLQDEIIIKKNFPNSFRNTSLSEQLSEMKIKRLVICGMMTHMCIDATTRAAFDNGFECIVLHDACATRTLSFKDVSIPAEHVHGSFLAALGSVYAEVISVEELMTR